MNTTALFATALIAVAGAAASLVLEAAPEAPAAQPQVVKLERVVVEGRRVQTLPTVIVEGRRSQDGTQLARAVCDTKTATC